jgi:ParB family chromosome partitioning protein
MDSRTFVHHKTGQPATMNTAGIGKPTPPPATPTPPRREYESAVPLITPPATVLDRSLSAMDQEVAAIIEPEPRRAATPAIIAEPDPEPEAEPEAEAEDSDEYYTPLYIIKAARQVLGKIDLDPASCKVAQRVVLATVYLNKANDSLRPKIPWLGRVWLNPPFSNPAPFTTKLIEEYEAGRTKAAILLVNNGTETKWGQALLRRYPVCFVGAHDGYGSRISFWKNDPDEPRTGNRYAQMIFYMGQTPDTFAEVFSQFGVIKT